METARSRSGYGWIVFAGILLVLAGALDIVNGIRAIGAQDTAFDAIFWDNNIEAWGWFYLILGIVLVVTGISVFNRARWRTIWLRLVNCRRSASVRWSGTQTSGRNPLA